MVYTIDQNHYYELMTFLILQNTVGEWVGGIIKT